MAGLQRDTPFPTEIKLHQKSNLMEITFSDGLRFEIPYEFLRVHSPSAEVRGHGRGQEVLQSGKRDVAIVSIDAVGNYAIKPVFSDGHDSGIYSWDLLYDLGVRQEALWQEYLTRLAASGLTREPGSGNGTITAVPPGSGGCRKH